jgi:hypothetical protein
MYITGSDCPTGYFPINTKWGGTSTLKGILPGGGLRGMGYFRPNYAMARGLYPGGGLGALEVDPLLLFLGIDALLFAMFLSKKKSSRRGRRRGRVRRALARLRS